MERNSISWSSHFCVCQFPRAKVFQHVLVKQMCWEFLYVTWANGHVVHTFEFSWIDNIGNIDNWVFLILNFEFRIGLDLPFQKQIFLYLNSQTTDSQSGVITITPKNLLWVEDTEKLLVTFSHAWLILNEFTQFS